MSDRADLARLLVHQVRETSQARRERDLAIELLVQAVRSIGYLEGTLSATRERLWGKAAT